MFPSREQSRGFKTLERLYKHLSMVCKPIGPRTYFHIKATMGRCEWGTWANVDCEGAFGDADAPECDCDGVGASLDRPVGAAEHTVSLVLQDGLYAGLVALGVLDDSGDVTHASPCAQDREKYIFHRNI